MAEQMGVISQISDFVLSEACGQCAEWRRKGLDLGLAVNLSGREFSDAGLVDRIAGHLEENGLPGEVLTLEVTETEVMADLTQVSMVLDKLAALGICLAIDDYGTGYSSLAYIHRLPVQELKIDRSFVTNLPTRIEQRASSSIPLLRWRTHSDSRSWQRARRTSSPARCWPRPTVTSFRATTSRSRSRRLNSKTNSCRALRSNALLPSGRARPWTSPPRGRVVEGRRKGESTACAPSPCLQVRVDGPLCPSAS